MFFLAQYSSAPKIFAHEISTWDIVASGDVKITLSAWAAASRSPIRVGDIIFAEIELSWISVEVTALIADFPKGNPHTIYGKQCSF